DTDLLLQRQIGMSLQEYLSRHGLLSFLRAEEETLCVLSEEECVIATGGSAVYSEAGMTHLKKNAVTVYLSLPLNAVQKRLTDIRTRGVAMGEGQSIADLYEQRTPLYRQYADIIVDADGQSVEETVQAVWESIRDFAAEKDGKGRRAI
ncbi:MAG: shikimate kinase, partial [Clostridia bacterium]|nr:shikimate kinase [Clostridia bacterium]